MLVRCKHLCYCIGALISHDNVTYTSYICLEPFGHQYGKEVVMSYLPMSHVAAHMNDTYCVIEKAEALYIADKDALKGTLVSEKLINLNSCTRHDY